ncbi:MAG: LysR family transcriptional regulator [Alphaproteobacteria bacterium]
MADLVALFRTFTRVVEAGSFTAVADELNTSQPTISRQIAHLEEHLGCLLFQRTTRSLTLTEDGRLFYDHALRSLETLAEAESAVGRRRGKPSGTLRLASAVVLGRLHLVPKLPRLLARYPDLNVELMMNDGFSDLVEEGIDLAIRVGEVRDPGLVARRIGTSRRLVVATPDYLARAGTPQTPDDLKNHDCVIYGQLAAGANWTFDTDRDQVVVPVKGRVKMTNTEGVRAAILEGLGIGYVPVWHFVDKEIESGRLVALLKDWEPKPQPISVVYPSRRFLAPKVRAAIDFLAAEFDLDPLLSGFRG